MVDPENRFVFVHIPKTAGKSVSSFLRKQFLTTRQQVIQRAIRHVGRRTKADHYGLYRGREHGSARQIRDAIGAEAYDTAFSFAFVRNPWDRLYSLYKFEKSRPRQNRHDIAKSQDFETYLTHLYEEGLEPQLSFIQDSDGKNIVDFIGRFENLSADFEKVCNRLGVTARLPHKNASGGKSYPTQYTPKAQALVRELCAVDIEFFGYTFD